jgi:outer membrane protein assembly factor BamD (BamD/ComL family)
MVCAHMHGMFRLPILCALLISCGPWVTPAPGQAYVETQKKHSWFSFNRPAKKNPADQLAHADQLFAEGSLKKAGKAYKALAVTWPGSPESVPAQLRYARSLDARGKSEKAFEAYQTLMEANAGGFPYDDVLQRQFDLAQEMMHRRHGRLLLLGGFQAPERAVPMFEKVVQNGPRSPVAAEAQYLIGWAYEISDQLELAVVAYMTAQHRYPDTAYAEKSSFGRARALYRLSEESPNDEEALEQAWAGVVLFLNTYPQSEEIEVAKAYRDTLYSRRARTAYEKAVFYDRKAKKPAAALQAYRSFVKLFPGSEWVAVAQSRIDRLAAQVENTK